MTKKQLLNIICSIPLELDIVFYMKGADTIPFEIIGVEFATQDSKEYRLILSGKKKEWKSQLAKDRP